MGTAGQAAHGAQHPPKPRLLQCCLPPHQAARSPPLQRCGRRHSSRSALVAAGAARCPWRCQSARTAWPPAAARAQPGEVGMGTVGGAVKRGRQAMHVWRAALFGRRTTSGSMDSFRQGVQPWVVGSMRRQHPVARAPHQQQHPTCSSMPDTSSPGCSSSAVHRVLASSARMCSAVRAVSCTAEETGGGREGSGITSLAACGCSCFHSHLGSAAACSRGPHRGTLVESYPQRRPLRLPSPGIGRRPRRGAP